MIQQFYRKRLHIYIYKTIGLVNYSVQYHSCQRYLRVNLKILANKKERMKIKALTFFQKKG